MFKKENDIFEDIFMSKITLHVKIPNQDIEFETGAECTEKEDHSFEIQLLDAIYYEERRLTFHSMPVDLSFEENDKHYEAKHCHLEEKKIDDKWYYETNQSLKLKNRRGAVRIPCHEETTVQNPKDKIKAEAFTYDASVSGIGISADGKLSSLKVGDVCTIFLTINNHPVQVEGNVARIEFSGDGRYHIGFKIQEATGAYIEFVMAMQRRYLQTAPRGKK